MALFGDEDGGDVGPFVMTEGGEEWFPFTLDNLEMDRACNSSPPLDDSGPMEQDGDDETDQDDDDVDQSAEASGPGPPPPALPNSGGGNGWNTDGCEQIGNSTSTSGLGGAALSPKLQGKAAGRMQVLLPEPKARLDKVKPEAKEVNASQDRKRQTTEAAAQAKRTARDKSGGGGGSSCKSKQKYHRPSGGMAGGVGGMTGRAEGQAGWSTSSDAKHNSRTGGGGGDGGTTKASQSGSTSATAHGSGRGNGGSMTKPPTVQNKRRLERNAREQKRSLKISQRIEDLRRMLSQFGVDVKASKSAVLSEATDYIAHLQRQHAQSEAERARLHQLLHNARSASPSSSAAAVTVAAAAAASAGGLAPGAMGAVAPPGRTVKPPPTGASSPLVRHGGGGGGGGGVGGQALAHEILSETLLSLDDEGNMGRPTAGMAAATAVACPPPPQQQQQAEERIVPGFPNLSASARSGVDGMVPVVPFAPAAAAAAAAANLAATARALSHVNYERVFRTLPLPMAIANVNGNLVDCNTRLSQVTGFRKEEALFMTIFDLVADPFLQHTFSMISSILSMRGVTGNLPFFQVPGKHFNGSPGGVVVQISAVHDEQLRPMHFCICIIDSPAAGSVLASASVAAAAAATGTARVGGGGRRVCTGGNGLPAGGGLNGVTGGGFGRIVAAGPPAGPGGSSAGDEGAGGGDGGYVRVKANVA